VAWVGYILCEFVSTKQGNITKYFKIQYLNPHPTNDRLHRRSMNWRFTKVSEFSFSLTACPLYKNSSTTLKKPKKPPVLPKYRICMVKSTNLVHSSLTFLHMYTSMQSISKVKLENISSTSENSLVLLPSPCAVRDNHTST